MKFLSIISFILFLPIILLGKSYNFMDKQGRMVEAELVSLENDAVRLSLTSNGKEFVVPLARLSTDSAKLVLRLAKKSDREKQSNEQEEKEEELEYVLVERQRLNRYNLPNFNHDDLKQKILESYPLLLTNLIAWWSKDIDKNFLSGSSKAEQKLYSFLKRRDFNLKSEDLKEILNLHMSNQGLLSDYNVEVLTIPFPDMEKLDQYTEGSLGTFVEVQIYEKRGNFKVILNSYAACNLIDFLAPEKALVMNRYGKAYNVPIKKAKNPKRVHVSSLSIEGLLWAGFRREVHLGSNKIDSILYFEASSSNWLEENQYGIISNLHIIKLLEKNY